MESSQVIKDVAIIHGHGAQEGVDSEKPHLYILAHALGVANNPRRLVRELSCLASSMHSESVIYAPGIGKPAHIALLAYLGVGVFDSVPLAMGAAKRVRLSVDGEVSKRYKCHCPGCEGRDDIDLNAAYIHNCHAALAEVRKVRHVIEDGGLRGQ